MFCNIKITPLILLSLIINSCNFITNKDNDEKFDKIAIKEKQNIEQDSINKINYYIEVVSSVSDIDKDTVKMVLNEFNVYDDPFEKALNRLEDPDLRNNIYTNKFELINNIEKKYKINRKNIQNNLLHRIK